MKTYLPVTQNRIAISHPQEFNCTEAPFWNFNKMSLYDE